MPQFTVAFKNVCWSSVTVEADNWENAIDKAENSPAMPGSLTVGAFGPPGEVSVDSDQWYADNVTDEAGNEVWTDEHGEFQPPESGSDAIQS